MNTDTPPLSASRVRDLAETLGDMYRCAERSYSIMQLGARPMGDWCLRFLATASLMRELADICADSFERGIDFAIAPELTVLPMRAKYLREKLARMLGEQTLRGLCALWIRHDQVSPPHGAPSSRRLISSVDVEVAGNHERVRIWNRGALAGELVVCIGDGESLAGLLMGGQ